MAQRKLYHFGYVGDTGLEPVTGFIAVWAVQGSNL